MSDDRKRNARLQGKFSDPKESRSNRRDKKSEKKSSPNQNSSESDESMKGHVSKSKAAQGVNIEYQEKSKYTFEALADKVKVQEIRDRGVHELSISDNGLSRIIYEPTFFSLSEAEEMFIILRDTTQWYDKEITIHGQKYPQPRLVSWYGPYKYKYSGATLEATAMPSFIIQIKERVEAFLQKYDLHVNLNSVLLNLYRNGKDSVAWHSDDEYELGVEPTIASVSLGEMRTFQMRPKAHMKDLNPDTRFQVNLVSGSLLIMDGCMQKDWQHQVPKEYHDKEPRINLTFRTVYNPEKIPTEVPYLSYDSEESVCSSKAIQQKPVYDSDNFPPLNPSSNPKSKISKANSGPKNNSYHQKDITEGSTEPASESAINPIENNNDPITTASSTSEMSPPTELVDDTHSEDMVKSQSEEEDLVPEGSCTNNLEEIEAACTGGNKHKLNVNAPDFVPTTPFPELPVYERFKGLSLKDLTEYYTSCTDESCESEFFSAFMEELKYQRNKDYFPPREWFELDVYIKLSEGGQSVENQRVINKRIVSMIQNINKGYKRSMPQRTSRGRNIYRGNFYRQGNI